MTSVNNQVHSLDRKMTSVSDKVDKVDQDVLTQGWTYLGRGGVLGKDQESGQQGKHTLTQCSQICESKHSADHQWNGFLWKPIIRSCLCEKNDQGHDPTCNREFMHFHKQ